MSHIAAEGYPGGLPEKFFSGESILPGRKFTAKNFNWANSGRLKVTPASWLVMWRRCLATLRSNPTQVIEFSILERFARQAAILVNGLDEVQSTGGKDTVSKLIDDWIRGSVSLGTALDSAISSQSENWSIAHLPAFNEALITAQDKKVADEAKLCKVDPGQSPLQTLQIRQQELDEQVIEALLRTYQEEMAKIRRDLLSEQDVDQMLQKQKEALCEERYQESVKAAKHFWDHHIQILEFGPEHKTQQIWMRLQGAMFSALPTSGATKPRFLALMNFRVPQTIGSRNYDLGVSLIGLFLNQLSHVQSSAAVILAPEYPPDGRRKADIELVQALQDNMATISGVVTVAF